MFEEKDKWEFFKDAAGKWRWKKTSSSGRIVGTSAVGYTSKDECVENARKKGYEE